MHDATIYTGTALAEGQKLLERMMDESGTFSQEIQDAFMVGFVEGWTQRKVVELRQA
jgi:hypothetical protein